MPRYVITNPGRVSVPLPEPLSGAVPPQSNLTIDTQAVNVDTPVMQTLLRKGVLRMIRTVETPRISDHIEIPVVDMLGTGGLIFRGPWSALTSYVPNDVVQYASTSWVALLPSLGVTPVEGPFWTALVTLPTAANSGWNRIGIELVATGDPRIFDVPEDFIHVVGGLTIEVFHSAGGRRLKQAPLADPRLGDYYAVESAGVGTGYNQVHMLTFAPHALVANYRAA